MLNAARNKETDLSLRHVSFRDTGVGSKSEGIGSVLARTIYHSLNIRIHNAQISLYVSLASRRSSILVKVEILGGYFWIIGVRLGVAGMDKHRYLECQNHTVENVYKFKSSSPVLHAELA